MNVYRVSRGVFAAYDRGTDEFVIEDYVSQCPAVIMTRLPAKALIDLRERALKELEKKEDGT
jgi:hypothetical protein